MTKHVHIILEEDEHEVLLEQKGNMTWKDFLIKSGNLFAKTKEEELES